MKGNSLGTWSQVARCVPARCKSMPDPPGDDGDDGDGDDDGDDGDGATSGVAAPSCRASPPLRRICLGSTRHCH